MPRFSKRQSTDTKATIARQRHATRGIEKTSHTRDREVRVSVEDPVATIRAHPNLLGMLGKLSKVEVEIPAQ